MNQKKPSDRVWHVAQLPASCLILIAGIISQIEGVMWACCFLSVLLDAVSITVTVVSGADDIMFFDLEMKHQWLFRKIALLECEREQLREKNERLERQLEHALKEENPTC